MSVSLICACKNRNLPLQISLSSWLLFKEITEIIIVDWSSDESLNHLTEIDSKIKVITVSNQEYFNQPEPLNLAASLATGNYILKVDTDYVFNPYYNFFETYKIDDNSFLCGQNDYKEIEINSSPYFNHLRGLLYVSRKNFIKVGGYNETNIEHYAYEDDEIVHRLEMIGLTKKKICYDHNVIHIPHSDKKRLENFKAYNTDKVLEESIRDMLSSHYTGQELEWQVEYVLAQHHIEINRQKSLSQITDYHHKSNINWNIFKTNEQIYMAEKNKEGISKLKGLSKVYYISLEESLDRQKNIQKQFLQYGIPLYGVISKRFSESNDVVTGKYVHQLNDGTKGCCVSHLNAINHWYENHNDEYGFFCEDDLSLETVEYWDFNWQEFVDSLPEDWSAIQLVTIRKDFDTFELREREWNDWSVTAYIIKREYAKKLIDTYIQENTYCLDIPSTDIMPLIENIIFTTLGKTYTIPLFVEETNFQSTYSTEQDSDVKDGQKTNHYHANKIVLEYWKNKVNDTITMDQSDLQTLLTKYSLDTENPNNNFDLGIWYENNGHTAPALSYYLRCAERSEDLDLAYEALIRGSYCYEKQGTRDGTAKSILQQALCLLPSRPEAYFLLSRFSERREWWQDCYIYADWGLRYSDFDSKSLITDVEYPGPYGLLFEKSVSGWWWGKDKESIQISLDLYHNSEVSDSYKKVIEENLKKMGVNIPSNSQHDTLSDKKLSNVFDPSRHNTDKNDLGYLECFYDEFFEKLKNSPITMLEIGVYNGGSIKLWKDYLHEDAQIYAADIEYFDHVQDTFSIIGDMYFSDRSSKFADKFFDLIIDDGPHTFESFVVLMQKYHSKIKEGGTLIIEDIINPSWVTPLVELSKSLGYSSCEVIDVTGKQKTEDLINRWKNGLYLLNVTK